MFKTKNALSGIHIYNKLMNGMLLLRRENHGYHMLIPIPNSTLLNTQQSRLKPKVVTGLRYWLTKKGKDKQTFLKL